ncbi:hypothetical protein PIB30_112136, partial [Stylosanthes scabra]|nr:hypothetical protein [Stylosanthes scabra]
ERLGVLGFVREWSLRHGLNRVVGGGCVIQGWIVIGRSGGDGRPAVALATGSEFLDFQNRDSIFVEESKPIVRLTAWFVNKKGVTELATN